MEAAIEKPTKTLVETDHFSTEQGEVREQQHRVEEAMPDLSNVSFAFSTDTQEVAIEDISSAASRRRDAARNQVRNHVDGNVDVEAIATVAADRVDYTSRSTETSRGISGDPKTPLQNENAAALDPTAQATGLGQPNALTNGNQETVVLSDADKAALGYGIGVDQGVANGTAVSAPLTTEIGIEQGEQFTISKTISQGDFLTTGVSIDDQIRASYGVPIQETIVTGQEIGIEQPYASLVSVGMPDASSFTIDATQVEGLATDAAMADWLAVERKGELTGGLEAGFTNPDLRIYQDPELVTVTNQDRTATEPALVAPVLVEEQPILALADRSAELAPNTELTVDDADWGEFTFSTDLRKVA